MLSIKSILFFVGIAVLNINSFAGNNDNPLIELEQCIIGYSETNDNKTILSNIASCAQWFDTNLVSNVEQEKYFALLEQSVSLFKSRDLFLDFLQVKTYMVKFYARLGDDIEIIRLGVELIDVNEFQYTPDYPYVLEQLKKSYENTEQFNEVLQLIPEYQKAKAKLDGDNSASNNVEGDLAIIYYKLGNYDQALFYYQKLYTKTKHKLSLFQLSSTLNNIGLCYERLQKLDSAMLLYNEAIVKLDSFVEAKEFSKTKPSYAAHFRNVINGNKASVYVKKKRYNIARPLYFVQLESAKQEGEMHIVSSTYFRLALIEYYSKNYDKALDFLDDLDTVLLSHISNNLKLKSMELRARILTAKGLDIEANESYYAYHLYKDSIDRLRRLRNHQIATVKFEVSKTQRKLSDAQKQVEYERAINLYQKYGLIVSGVLLLVLSVFLVVQIKNKKRKSELIEIIDGSLREKEVLLKEMHHRVKNNLQVISGIMQLPARKTKDPVVLEAVKNSQRYISSMAQVHQMLHQDEIVTTVSIKKFLKRLTDSLLYSFPNRDVSIELALPEVEISIDHATPLGLIVTELVTNSFKYAFVNSGKIDVKLHDLGNNKYSFEYTDNGVGLPDDFDITTVDSIGFKLIKMLSQEMNAELAVSSDNGIWVELKFEEDHVS